MATAPDRVITTPQLILRCWDPDDAQRLKTAIDLSLAHLREWMPWAMDEPSNLEIVKDRLTGFRDRFEAGEDFIYGIFSSDESEVCGGAGLHTRRGPGTLEIGYWIRSDRLQMGFATETAVALTRMGLSVEGIERIEIRCDPLNLPSAAIPRRLGYRHLRTLKDNAVGPQGEPRDTMVWEMRETDLPQ